MVISLFAFKGGVGKSSLSLNLAYQLSKSFKVLLVDSTQLNALSLFMCRKIGYGFSDVVSGKKRIENSIVEINENLSFIPSGHAVLEDTEEYEKSFSSINAKEILIKIKNLYDFIIFDTDARASKPLFSILQNCDRNFYVINPTPDSVAAFKIFKDRYSEYLRDCEVLVNMMRPDSLYEDFYSYIQAVTKNNIVGSVPYDRAVSESIGNCLSVYEYDRDSAFVYNIEKICEKLKKENERI
jgi:MinD-like ATPase involved in chromosome partitioning or flagellar assembly